jgi:hypothetical protein
LATSVDTVGLATFKILLEFKSKVPAILVVEPTNNFFATANPPAVVKVPPLVELTASLVALIFTDPEISTNPVPVFPPIPTLPPPLPTVISVLDKLFMSRGLLPSELISFNLDEDISTYFESIKKNMIYLE